MSAQLKQYYGRLRRPPSTRPLPGRYASYRTGPLRRNNTQPPGRVGPPQFPPPPSERSAPSTPGSSSGLQSRLCTPSVAFALRDGARLFLFPTRGWVTLTARQASLRCCGPLSRSPFTGLLTLGFDPARFPAEPPACYRASWQLPGPDLHRQATTSLRWIRSTHRPSSNYWAHSPGVVEIEAPS